MSLGGYIAYDAVRGYARGYRNAFRAYGRSKPNRSEPLTPEMETIMTIAAFITAWGGIIGAIWGGFADGQDWLGGLIIGVFGTLGVLTALMFAACAVLAVVLMVGYAAVVVSAPFVLIWQVVQGIRDKS